MGFVAYRLYMYAFVCESQGFLILDIIRLVRDVKDHPVLLANNRAFVSL